MDTTRASLLQRVRSPADASAWREFDSLYRPMLERFAAARGLNPSDVDDVVQHCMAAIAEHIRDFAYDPLRGRFKGWLRTLVNNRIRTLHRDRHDRLADTADFDRSQHREESPDEAFDRAWRQAHLRHCLSQLQAEIEEPTYRAFHAHVLEEQSVEQVCERFNMTPNQVRLIKFRVTSKLRAALRDLLGEHE